MRKFVVEYFDDILVYSRDPNMHVEHLRNFFEVLREQKLYANFIKCEFLTDNLIFLGYVISLAGIKVDPKKITIVLDWPTPKSIQDILSFHELASFYRRFIRNFSSLVEPITVCLKLRVFKWTMEADNSFQAIKKLMTETPMLALSYYHKAFKVECDASFMGGEMF